MDTGTAQQVEKEVGLAEDIEQNLAETVTDSPEEIVEDLEPEIIEEPPLAPPSKWDGRYKQVFEEWGKHPNGRTWQQAMLDYEREQKGYLTQIEQERAGLRRMAEPLQQAIQPYNDMIAMSGMTPDAAIRMGLGLMMSLKQNPRDTLVQLAQRSGLDLSQIAQDVPYVDPQVQNLQQEMQRLRETYRQREERQAQERLHQVQSEIDQQLNSFANAKDESGNPKFTHFAIPEVQEEMAAQIRGFPNLSLEEAYSRACRIRPEVAQADEHAKRVKEAAQRAAKAKKEQEAARRVAGKYPGEEPVSAESLEAEILKHVRQQAA